MENNELEEQLAELEKLHAQLEEISEKDAEEKGMSFGQRSDDGTPSIFLTDMKFKEAMDAGDLIDEDTFNALDEEEKKGYEKVNVIDEKTQESMGWAFRFKVSEEDEDAEEKGYGSMHDRDDKDEGDMKDMFETAAEAAERAAEIGCEGSHGHDNGMFMPCEDMDTYTNLMSKKGYGSMHDDDDDKKKKKEDTAEMAEKASRILENLTREADEDEDENPDVPAVFLSKADFDEKCHTGEYLDLKGYGQLDDDAKEAFELVQVYDEDSEKGYGMRYRRRKPMKRNLEYKEKFFDSAEAAAEAASKIGCSGAHEVDGKFMPCESPEEYAKLTGQGEAEQMETMGKGEDFLCGFQRKSVMHPCDFCRGGCAPEGDLPGLADIEAMVKSAHEGSEIVGSGYSTADDIFVLDVKRADGSAIEIFVSGEGEELGWLKIDESLLEEKTAQPLDIISQSDAEYAAVKAIGGEAYSVSPDIFNNEDVYVVQLETADEKSFDVFVDMQGKVLGYDEYEVELPLSEEDEIKALEAELELKRMYSREQRQEMAENGDALPDGSFPIADEADLRNAIQAYGRAADKEAAKAHIMKRAEELGLQNLIPEEFMVGTGDQGAKPEAPEKPEAEQMMEEEKGLEDLGIDIDEALREFESLKEEFDGLS